MVVGPKFHLPLLPLPKFHLSPLPLPEFHLSLPLPEFHLSLLPLPEFHLSLPLPELQLPLADFPPPVPHHLPVHRHESFLALLPLLLPHLLLPHCHPLLLMLFPPPLLLFNLLSLLLRMAMKIVWYAGAGQNPTWWFLVATRSCVANAPCKSRLGSHPALSVKGKLKGCTKCLSEKNNFCLS